MSEGDVDETPDSIVPGISALSTTPDRSLLPNVSEAFGFSAGLPSSEPPVATLPPNTSSNPGGGALVSVSITREPANATAAGPYGRPNRSGASRAVIILICSGVSPPRGIRNSVRVRVCGRGAEIVLSEIIEGEESTTALPVDEERVRVPRNKCEREPLGVVGRVEDPWSEDCNEKADALRECVDTARVVVSLWTELERETNGCKRKLKRERGVSWTS